MKRLTSISAVKVLLKDSGLYVYAFENRLCVCSHSFSQPVVVLLLDIWILTLEWFQLFNCSVSPFAAPKQDIRVDEATGVYIS